MTHRKANFKVCPQIKQDKGRRHPSWSGKNVDSYKVMILSNLRSTLMNKMHTINNNQEYNIEFPKKTAAH